MTDVLWLDIRDGREAASAGLSTGRRMPYL